MKQSAVHNAAMMMMLFVLNGDNDDREENGVVELDVTRTTRAAKASKLLFAAVSFSLTDNFG